MLRGYKAFFTSLTISLTVMILQNQAFAGANGSGGGNARVCFTTPSVLSTVKAAIQANDGWVPDKYISSSFVTSVEMLDTVEAKDSAGTWDSNTTPVLISPNSGETADHLYSRILARFEALVPGLVTSVKDGADHLKNVVIKDHGIARIDDIGNYEIINDDKCMRFTIVAQFDDGAVGSHVEKDPRFFALPETIFSALDRAVARLHENAYYTPRHLSPSQGTSDSTRKLVGLMITTNIQLSDLVMAITNFDSQLVYMGPVGYDTDRKQDQVAGVADYATFLYKILYEASKSRPVLIEWHAEGSNSGWPDELIINNHESFNAFKARCEAFKESFKSKMQSWFTQTVRPMIFGYSSIVPSANLEKIASVLSTGYTNVQVVQYTNQISCRIDYPLLDVVVGQRQVNPPAEGGIFYFAGNLYYTNYNTNLGYLSLVNFIIP